MYSPPPFPSSPAPNADQWCINSLSLKRRKSGKYKDCFSKSKIQENRYFSLWRRILRETCFLNIINTFYIFITLGKWKIGLLYNNRTRFNFKEWWTGTINFFRFENYFLMLCLKIAHLGRLSDCFERQVRDWITLAKSQLRINFKKPFIRKMVQNSREF